MHLGLVFAASSLFSVTVVWKWIFKETELWPTNERTRFSADTENYLAKQPESRTSNACGFYWALEIIPEVKNVDVSIS